MPERLNLRVLHLPTANDVAREIARIEPYPERVAATTPKGIWKIVHVAGMAAIAATILKQELLALDADCVISPEVYLGDRDTVTDVLIMASLRQYQALIPRLRPFPIPDLPQLATELADLLRNVEQTERTMVIGEATVRWGERTYVMGIVNVTPDSFSGDGLLLTEPPHDQATVVRTAVEQARSFAAAGADMLDIGGESTRPGARSVPVDEELARVVPVIAAIQATVPLPISVDTVKAEVAQAALDAGAHIVNDVWGLRQPGGGWNEPLARLVAERDVPLVLMHNRRAQAVAGAIGGHYEQVRYGDLMADIIRDLRESIEYAVANGIARDKLIVDPGIGFGKTPAQNVEVLRQLDQLRSLGLPMLLGTSRKSFIGKALNTPPDERMEGTAATVVLGIQAGVDIVRAHDVGPIVRVARMTDAILRPGAWERVTEQ